MENRLLNKSPGRLVKSVIAFSALLLISISSPARSETAVYGWQDESGAISYSDDPTNAPGDAAVKVLSQTPEPEVLSEPISEPVSESEPTQVVAPPPVEPTPRTVTEGELAVQLVEELGLADDPTETEAVDLLTSARISPKLGQWELDQPVSSELTVRLRRLTVAAADQGRITLTPEQGLLAFDTASALLGLDIPVAPIPEETPNTTAYPIAETPPLVYVSTPPPDIYPYYIWTPVGGGFWWNGYAMPGFFVLNVTVFASDHHHHFPAKDRAAFDPGRIGRQFRSRIPGHPKEFHPVPYREGVTRSAFHPGQGSSPDRTAILPKGRNMNPSRHGTDLSGAVAEGRHASSPITTENPAVRRRLLPPRSDSATAKPFSKSKPDRSLAVDATTSVKPLSARSAEPGSRVRPWPSSPSPVPGLIRTSPSSSGPQRSVNNIPVVNPAPPRNQPDRSVGVSVPAPRPPSMEQRFVPRPQQTAADNIAGRGPLSR